MMPENEVGFTKLPSGYTQRLTLLLNLFCGEYSFQTVISSRRVMEIGVWKKQSKVLTEIY